MARETDRHMRTFTWVTNLTIAAMTSLLALGGLWLSSMDIGWPMTLADLNPLRIGLLVAAALLPWWALVALAIWQDRQSVRGRRKPQSEADKSTTDFVLRMMLGPNDH